MLLHAFIFYKTVPRTQNYSSMKRDPNFQNKIRKCFFFFIPQEEEAEVSPPTALSSRQAGGGTTSAADAECVYWHKLSSFIFHST